MDKLKEFLGLFRRQHFWFLSPVVVALAAVGWYLASNKVQSDVNKHKGEISGLFSQVSAIKGSQAEGKGHPNTTWQDGMNKLIALRTENVKQAWTKKWDRQKDILKWPDGLSFKTEVEKLRPIESVNTTTNRLDDFELDEYKNFVKSELPKLAERIRSRWAPLGGSSVGPRRQGKGEPGAGRSTESFTNDATDESIIVSWSEQNQGEIDSKFDWGTRFPSTLEVLYAQEDLWVLNAIMDIIKATNGDARTRSSAPVKHIFSIRFGKDVATQEFKVIRPAAAVTGEPDPSATQTPGEEPPAEGKPDRDSAGESSEGASTGEGAVDRPPHPAAGRYVNDKFTPIQTEEEVKSSADVAKRIPVRLRVRMDHREVNRLLAACANAPLTFEVRQLRFNPQDSGEVFTSVRNTERGSFSSGAENVKQLTDLDTFDRTVELYGIIYIFNPVNPTLLSGEATPAAEPAPGST